MIAFVACALGLGSVTTRGVQRGFGGDRKDCGTDYLSFQATAKGFSLVQADDRLMKGKEHEGRKSKSVK